MGMVSWKARYGKVVKVTCRPCSAPVSAVRGMKTKLPFPPCGKGSRQSCWTAIRCRSSGRTEDHDASSHAVPCTALPSSYNWGIGTIRRGPGIGGHSRDTRLRRFSSFAIYLPPPRAWYFHLVLKTLLAGKRFPGDSRKGNIRKKVIKKPPFRVIGANRQAVPLRSGARRSAAN